MKAFEEFYSIRDVVLHLELLIFRKLGQISHDLIMEKSCYTIYTTNENEMRQTDRTTYISCFLFFIIRLCIVFDFDLKYIYSIHSSEIKRFRLSITIQRNAKKICHLGITKTQIKYKQFFIVFHFVLCFIGSHIELKVTSLKSSQFFGLDFY